MSNTAAAAGGKSPKGTGQQALEIGPRSNGSGTSVAMLAQAVVDACRPWRAIRSVFQQQRQSMKQSSRSAVMGLDAVAGRVPTPSDPIVPRRGKVAPIRSTAQHLQGNRSAGPMLHGLLVEHAQFLQRIRQCAGIAGELEGVEKVDVRT